MTDDDDVRAAAGELLGDPHVAVQNLVGGANNRVWLVTGASGRFLAKRSPPAAAHERQRARSEFDFSSFLWRHDVRCIPRPVALDAVHQIGLYEYVDGSPISTLQEHHVHQAVAFARALGELGAEPDAAVLGAAADARFSLREHLDLVEARVERLRAVAVPDDAVEFVTTLLVPAWRRVHDAASKEQVAGRLPPALSVLSPSDFGFHNALERSDGSLVFFDFEYAGWDDPAKMLGDIFLQPALPVPRAYFERFTAAITKPTNRAFVVERTRILFPVLRLKWVTILLNELLPGGWARRAFAGRSDRTRRIAEQLARARSLLLSSDDLGG